MDVAHCTEMHNDGSCRFVIRGFEDQQAVVIAQGLVDFLDLCTELLRLGLEERRSLGRVVNVLDALLGELDRRDERRHRSVFLWVGFA